jgi:hypothetical protein
VFKGDEGNWEPVFILKNKKSVKIYAHKHMNEIQVLPHKIHTNMIKENGQ